MNFDFCFDILMQHECRPPILPVGGGYVDDPNDKGGRTVYGISTLIIKRLGIKPEELGIKDFSAAEMKKVKIGDAKAFYKKYYWDAHNYGSITNEKVATKICDVSINMGEGRAHMYAQMAANKCGAKLKVDGILGPKSIEAINKCDPKAWMKEMCALQLQRYRDLVKADPTQAKFLAGWTKRANWGL